MIDTCYVGDVRDGLRVFIDAGHRARTCVTSPPYWGLRDYGVAGQLGLEPTIAEYVANMVDVFRCMRDALADDGTIWVNLGDSYARAGGPGWQGKTGQRADRRFTATRDTVAMREIGRRPPGGLKSKDMCGIPWRVAFALQDDGWYLRSDIIWHKPNPMPESVTDRPTKSHEYLFLLAKSERYFYDADAIKESSLTNDPRRPYGSQGAWDMDGRPTEQRHGGDVRTQRKPAGWDTGDGAHGTIHRDGRAKVVEYTEVDATSRNRRTVWTIATEPFSEAHFATFPTALVEPCILAGSRVGDIVLDPFMGSGTTAMVAQSLGRRWFGCELNPAYAAMQSRRAAQTGMVFA